MTDTFSLSACLLLHDERESALTALQSFAAAIRYARNCGTSVETILVLDRIDPVTLALANRFRHIFDRIENASGVGSSEARNLVCDIANGTYVALADAFSIWGSAWLPKALAVSEREEAPMVLHPAVIYRCRPADLLRAVGEKRPPIDATSDYLYQIGDDDPSFTVETLEIINLWQGDFFARRSTFLEHRFSPVPLGGLPFDADWRWNLRTVRAGIAHRVVPGTIHAIMMR